MQLLRNPAAPHARASPIVILLPTFVSADHPIRVWEVGTIALGGPQMAPSEFLSGEANAPNKHGLA